jgi:hypothetical protein
MSTIRQALLIIGNGFDKACGLKSAFSDFFEVTYTNQEFYKRLKGIPKSSSHTFKFYIDILTEFLEDPFFDQMKIWDFYFIMRSINNGIYEFWADVESSLYNSLNIRDQEGKVKYKTLWEEAIIILASLFDNMDKEVENEEDYIAIYMYVKQKKHNYSEAFYRDFLYTRLLIELIDFEIIFSKYLLNIQSVDDYVKIANKKLEDITKHRRDRVITSILNFNYTTPFNDINSENVHGKLDTKASKIIIGIDSSRIQYQDPGYIFTKTYRKMHMYFRKDDKQVNSILSDEITHVIFYGHSLGEQDYAYFQSIFDLFDIYKKNIQLEFLYSIYNEKNASLIKSEQLNSVTKLLFSYGNTHLNPHQGRNLLHKLLLEGRVSIQKL